MSSSGVLAYELSTGSTDSMKFMDFLRGSLIPSMQPFPDKHSVIIMDNCSIHHTQEVKDLIENSGIVLFCTMPAILLSPHTRINIELRFTGQYNTSLQSRL